MEEEVNQQRAIIIGGSAGALKVILKILRSIRPDFNIPIIIIIHRKNDPNSGLVDVLAQSSSIPVKEAEDKEFILPGKAYLAPAGYHLLIEQDRSFSLDGSELVNFSRPSIDVSFQTAADTYGSGLLAVILSGANHDGTLGAKAVRQLNGKVIAQDPAEAETPVMPEQVITNGFFTDIGGTERMIEIIDQYSAGKIG